MHIPVAVRVRPAAVRPGLGRRPGGSRAATAKWSLIWALLFFVTSEVVLHVAMEHILPQLCAPANCESDYGVRRGRLHERLAENPNQGLVLLLGSSRTSFGVQPQRLNAVLAANGSSLIGFNFGISGAGVLRERVALERLLAEGVRPKVLVIEVIPTLLNYSAPGRYTEDRNMEPSLPWLTLPEIVVLGRYHSDPVHMAHVWAEAWLFPWRTYQRRIQEGLDSRLLAPTPRPPFDWEIDPWGGEHADWQPLAPDAMARLMEQAYQDLVRQVPDYRVGDGSRRALRDMLAICQREGIQAAVVFMPEGSDYHRWYEHGAEAEVVALADELRRTYDVDVIDARRWFPDSELWDGSHLLASGAEAYTLRLAPEIMRLAERGHR